jgi:hypothetical protein
MVVIVPGEDGVAPVPGVREIGEAVRVVRPILQGFEVRLGVGIVIRDVGTGMGLDDA